MKKTQSFQIVAKNGVAQKKSGIKRPFFLQTASFQGFQRCRDGKKRRRGPNSEEVFEAVLDGPDSGCDDKDLKDQFANDFGIELKASLNPRSRKTVTENLPKGMDRLTPSGNLICNGGLKMDYQGLRLDTEKFIYHAPVNDDNVSVCSECDNKKSCSPASDKGRYVTIPIDMLPHIDTDDPPMSKRFKALMTRRPSVERMIKQLKCDLSDDRLTKRGNDSFQAHLDKTMIAFHILLRNQR